MRMRQIFFNAFHHHHHGHAFGHGEDRGDHGHHEHHAGRGPFGGHHGGGDFFADWNEMRGGGRRGGGGGRMFGHGDLKLLLLALIEQQPRHGYELIRIIEDMFHGQYSPSPGAIYPTLTMLEELGHAEVTNEQGGRKLYAITAAGRAYLDENRDAVDAVTARTEHSARMAAKMAAPMSVRKAMHALKHALLMRGSDWNKAEAQRVAEILERAATAIATGEYRD
ncbi:PadR family transcriptional regulator [Rhodanobacter sp. C05]|nr:PadR family transcriptional regulator [Rhodanobacter sp. C05]